MTESSQGWRRCPQCGGLAAMTAHHCLGCGHVFEQAPPQRPSLILFVGGAVVALAGLGLVVGLSLWIRGLVWPQGRSAPPAPSAHSTQRPAAGGGPPSAGPPPEGPEESLSPPTGLGGEPYSVDCEGAAHKKHGCIREAYQDLVRNHPSVPAEVINRWWREATDLTRQWWPWMLEDYRAKLAFEQKWHAPETWDAHLPDTCQQACVWGVMVQEFAREISSRELAGASPAEKEHWVSEMLRRRIAQERGQVELWRKQDAEWTEMLKTPEGRRFLESERAEREAGDARRRALPLIREQERQEEERKRQQRGAWLRQH